MSLFTRRPHRRWLAAFCCAALGLVGLAAATASGQVHFDVPGFDGGDATSRSCTPFRYRVDVDVPEKRRFDNGLTRLVEGRARITHHRDSDWRNCARGNLSVEIQIYQGNGLWEVVGVGESRPISADVDEATVWMRCRPGGRGYRAEAVVYDPERGGEGYESTQVLRKTGPAANLYACD